MYGWGHCRNSAAQSQLRAALGIAAGGYDSFADGLEALARGEIDAFVAGEPILRYEVANRFRGRLQVLGSSFMREDFAFALPLNSGLRRNINESPPQVHRHARMEDHRTVAAQDSQNNHCLGNDATKKLSR